MSAPRGPRLIDLMGVVVGYVLAAILVRALFPSAAREPSSARVLVVLMLEYAWMGLAMSGPIVLAIDRREDRGPSGPPRYTWAERSWLVIGAYWIALTLLIAPARLRADPRLGAMPVVGALLFVGGVAYAGSGPWRKGVRASVPPTWTHRMGLGLVLAWPLAWAGLVLLSV